MSKRTIALIVFLILITAGLIYLAVKPSTLAPIQPAVVKKVVPTVPPETTIMMVPNPLTLSSSSGSLDIIVDTNQNKISAVQIEASFDPKIITKVTLKPGPLLPNAIPLINNVDFNTGKISYALGISPNSKPVGGKGVAAVLEFTANNYMAKSTTITLLPKSLVAGVGTSKSLLKESVGTVILFKQAPVQSATQPASQ